FRLAVEPLTARLGAENPRMLEFLSIITALQNLPSFDEQEPGRIVERQREKDVARTRLLRLVGEEPAVGAPVGDASARIHRTPGTRASFDRLHELLEAQAYRLAYWRTASHEINYRRFFDVNTLAGLRIEVPEVFAATHKLLGQLLRDGSVQGVRVDHPD